MTVTVYATIRSRIQDPDSAGTPEAREVQGEGEDYAAAKTAVDSQIPDGWQNLGYSTWPCPRPVQ